jgi:hypothetical protein
VLLCISDIVCVLKRRNKGNGHENIFFLKKKRFFSVVSVNVKNFIRILHFGLHMYFFTRLRKCFNFDRKWVGSDFGRYFHKLIWSGP